MKKRAEYTEGRKALENFDKAMTALMKVGWVEDWRRAP